jgi:hypothetical protein
VKRVHGLDRLFGCPAYEDESVEEFEPRGVRFRWALRESGGSEGQPAGGFLSFTVNGRGWDDGSQPDSDPAA